MDTLKKKSCSPCMKKQWCMSKNWIYSWLWKSSKTRQQYCRSESFSMKTDMIPSSNCVNFTCQTNRTERPVDQAHQNFHKQIKKESMIERGNPLSADSGRANSEIPEWLQEFGEILVVCKFLNTETQSTILLMKYLWSLRLREVWIGVNTVFRITSPKTEIARSVRGRKFWWLDNSRSQGPQWQLRISKLSPFCSGGAERGHPMDPVKSV